MRQLTAIGVLQLAAQWQPMGQTARLDAVLARKLRQIMRGRLTLDGGVGGDDPLADLATGQALGQHIQASLQRTQAIEWPPPARQYDIKDADAGRLTHRTEICRHLSLECTKQR